MGSAKAEVGVLENADGSGSYVWNGYEVLAAVNGPVEVQRRDELPEEAAIDVVIRPAAGVAAIRERHFESLIHRVLKQVIRTQAHPRTLIQVTLQVTSTPETSAASARIPQAASNLPLLPVLLNAALLALLSSTIPLETTYAAAFFVIDDEKTIVTEATSEQVDKARSVHALCLDRKGDVLLSESEGSFELDEWISVVEQAKSILLEGSSSDGAKMDVEADATGGLDLVRKTVTARLAKHDAWRQPR